SRPIPLGLMAPQPVMTARRTPAPPEDTRRFYPELARSAAAVLAPDAQREIASDRRLPRVEAEGSPRSNENRWHRGGVSRAPPGSPPQAIPHPETRSWKRARSQLPPLTMATTGPGAGVIRPARTAAAAAAPAGSASTLQRVASRRIASR